MEYRKIKIISSSVGGTAKGKAKTYKVSLPTKWVREMGLDEDKNVEISFDGERIVIERMLSPLEFAKAASAKGHSVKKLTYYCGKNITSVIYADFTSRALKVENFASDIMTVAFGNNTSPSWEDFEYFLSEHCVPKERFGIREYLEAIDVGKYDLLEIIKKTKGRMAENDNSIEVDDI